MGYSRPGAIPNYHSCLLPVFNCYNLNIHRGSHGLCFVYDVTSRSSFDNVERWLGEANQYLPETDNVIKILIGNKIDLPRRVITFHEAELMARKNGMLYIETSAKTKIGIEEAFQELITKILETSPHSLYEAKGSKLTTEREEEEPGSCGC